MNSLNALDAALALIGLVLLLALSVPATLFPVLYGSRSAWRLTRTGRALFWSTTSYAVVVCLTALFRFLTGVDVTIALLVQVAVFTFLNTTAWLMLASLLSAQKADREYAAQNPVPLNDTPTQ
jgi:hypothetical protein